MRPILDDPWLDLTFQLDSAIEAEQRAARRKHREVVQVPRLRAIGSLWLFATVCLHNAVFLGRVHWRALAIYGALQLSYVCLSWYSLIRHARHSTSSGLGSFYLATDIVIFVLGIYVSGGERSWLLPLLCVRVADQVGTSQRRALAFANATSVLHLALVAYLALVEQRQLSLPAELCKVLFVYVLNLYLVLAAGPSELQRKRATQMAEKTRELIAELASKTELLERERVRAEAASHAKSRFLANMSHEIRTPMNGVLGTAELLLEGQLGAEQRQMLETIASSGRSLLAIVNDVLDMSKIEAGGLKLEEIGFHPERLIAELIRGVRLEAEQKRIALAITTCEEARLTVVGDPLRLRQVLTNLIGNALKFTERGSVALTVTAQARSTQSVTLRFEIRDTGIGMTREACERVFDPFKQADDSTTRRFGGTGLGLSIAKQLVEMMGGRIEVESEPGKGSCFSFALTFPFGTLRASANASAGGDDSVARLRARNTHVLVAEDTAVNRVLVQKMLELLGCRVTTVDNGKLAAELLCSEHDFSLALMDWHMPVLDGIEATERVRAWERSQPGPRHTPIIAFTASAFTEEAARCKQAGMDGILNKPLTKLQLQQTLERHVLATAPTPIAEAEAEPEHDDDPPLRRSHIDELLELDAATPGGFLAGVVGNFLETSAVRLEELEEAIRASDHGRVEQLAHRIKGSAANLGALRMTQPLDQLELAARKGSLSGAEETLARVRAEHQSASEPLREILRSLETRIDPPS